MGKVSSVNCCFSFETKELASSNYSSMTEDAVRGNFIFVYSLYFATRKVLFTTINAPIEP